MVILAGLEAILGHLGPILVSPSPPAALEQLGAISLHLPSPPLFHTLPHPNFTQLHSP